MHVGCGDASETSDGSGGAGASTNNGQGGVGGTGSLVTTFSGPGTGGGGGDDSCASMSQEATLQSRPVDIIVAIDNSGSMSGEIEEVEVQMTRNFAGILDAAVPAIDYRVIMVSDYGDYNARDICIAAPLGAPPDADMDGHCDTIPPMPTDTANFFHHSTSVSSHDALCRLIDEFDDPDDFNLHPNGYQDLLRDDSYKFFLVITDDGVSCTNPGDYDDNDNLVSGEAAADQWDADLLALSPQHFGTAMDRNYTFWSPRVARLLT